MKIGFVGLGKLGLPVALSIENKGYEVCGYDINPAVAEYIKERKIPYREEGTPELLEKTNIQVLDSIEKVIEQSNIVFVPVQTPHHPMYEGITRIPDERVDFDYTYLKSAITEINKAVGKCMQPTTVIIISTVLPGTIEREIQPIISGNKYFHLCYNPFFIAMGTTRRDFEQPEFVLLGCDYPLIADYVEKFYHTLHDRPVFKTTIKNAELIKVLYNTFISTKIAFINTAMEICHHVGADVDAVSDALSQATERIISTKYLRGGMGDGGGCHPRDNIALSWLARKYNMSFDWFDAIMKQREKQTEWFASLIVEQSEKKNLPVIILGQSFKKETNLIVGSPAVLLGNILKEAAIEPVYFDPHVDPVVHYPDYPAIFFIGINHEEFKEVKFAPGSIVIDPWRMITDQEGVEVIRIGGK